MISLLHPSRGRPEKAYETATRWIERAGVPVQHIFSLDKSDPTHGDYKIIHDCLIFDNSSVVEATNRAATEADFDILIYLSDDFDCPENWGPVVLKEFENESRPLLVKVDDCLQKMETAVLTIPMMNRQLYERLGYFWHPGYKSMFCDEDLYWTVRKLGALKNAPNLKFQHNHVSVGRAQDDETYRRSAANWEQGKAFFAQRKGQGFPL